MQKFTKKREKLLYYLFTWHIFCQSIYKKLIIYQKYFIYSKLHTDQIKKDKKKLKNTFLKVLTKLTKNYEKRLITIGDFNARIGKKI